MFEKLRGNFFWFCDLLQGGNIRSHYNQIKYLFEGRDDDLQRRQMQQQSIQNLINHAKDTVAYYKQYEKVKSITDFKVIDKNIIRDSYNDFLSDKYHMKSLKQVYTSGSTGTPFKVYQDKNKRRRNAADNLFFAEKSGYKIGEKLYYIRHWDQYNKKGLLEFWLKNMVMHPISSMADDDIEKLLDKIRKDKKNVNIISYASGLEKIAQFIKKTSPQKAPFHNIKSILSIAEAISETSKSILSDYFNTPVICRYSNVENGILSQQIVNKEDGYYINTASYYVEILDMNEDKVLPLGSMGRIVITDLYNYAMPMIRYDTGDIGQLECVADLNNKKLVLKKIEGRKSDMIYDTRGKHISSYTVYHLLKYSHIEQYQFIQANTKEYIFKLKVTPEFSSEKEIKREFKDYLGEDSKISFEYVNEIPLLSSGKRKFVVNNYHKHARKGMTEKNKT
ncbi:CoF synthetase [Zhouia spongiae]|uniref:CoF synthetase n=1 Tax=Zhouia spongiae TaxID=2202721 RepID=A0ABY3YLC6_9FLAO|nr:CoF synthetase [Zhouia spongiae]UNY98402.1 CoF synthetase [Zhouia spongiae]